VVLNDDHRPSALLLHTVGPLQVARITVTVLIARWQVDTATVTVATLHRARLRVFDCCADDWTRSLVKVRSLRRGSVTLRVVECIPVAYPIFRSEDGHQVGICYTHSEAPQTIVPAAPLRNSAHWYYCQLIVCTISLVSRPNTNVSTISRPDANGMPYHSAGRAYSRTTSSALRNSPVGRLSFGG
jgi:hypothetical protein